MIHSLLQSAGETGDSDVISPPGQTLRSLAPSSQLSLLSGPESLSIMGMNHYYWCTRHVGLGRETLASQSKNDPRRYSLATQKTLPPSVYHAGRDFPEENRWGTCFCPTCTERWCPPRRWIQPSTYCLSQGTGRQPASSKHGGQSISHPSCSPTT